MYKFEPFYRVKVEKVTDGDTIVVSFYMGLGIWLNEQKVRLLGINAPEKTGETREIGLKVTAYLESLIKKSADVIVRTDEGKKGKYGRFLVIVYGKIDGKWINFNERLVSVGAAREYMAADAADAKEVFDPAPADIERRVKVDEELTEMVVYSEEGKMDGAKIAQELLTAAKSIVAGEVERQLLALRKRSGGKTIFQFGDYFYHVWFTADVGRTDRGDRSPSSGEWEVIIFQNEEGRGKEMGREYFRYVEEKMAGRVASAAADWIKRKARRLRR